MNRTLAGLFLYSLALNDISCFYFLFFLTIFLIFFSLTNVFVIYSYFNLRKLGMNIVLFLTICWLVKNINWHFVNKIASNYYLMGIVFFLVLLLAFAQKTRLGCFF